MCMLFGESFPVSTLRTMRSNSCFVWMKRMSHRSPVKILLYFRTSIQARLLKDFTFKCLFLSYATYFMLDETDHYYFRWWYIQRNLSQQLPVIKWVWLQETFPFLSRTWSSALILDHGCLLSPQTVGSHFNTHAHFILTCVFPFSLVFLEFCHCVYTGRGTDLKYFRAPPGLPAATGDQRWTLTRWLKVASLWSGFGREGKDLSGNILRVNNWLVWLQSRLMPQRKNAVVISWGFRLYNTWQWTSAIWTSCG